MAATSGWNTWSTADSIGNNQLTNNSSGFSALPAGMCSPGTFYEISNFTSYWTSSGNGSSNTRSRVLYYRNDGVDLVGDVPSSGASVRCLRNN